ncbi:hypothetical protein [Mycobacterium lepromatosis]|nr:hypothetical protein [Mycobacterium lepromatosis]
MISDSGYGLVAACIAAGLPVGCLLGSTALAALNRVVTGPNAVRY